MAKASKKTPAPPAPALAENRKKLLKNLMIHRRLVEAGQVLLLGLTLWYVIVPSFWALKDSLVFKAFGQALFGTATSSGIPVTIAQALLPAFMAPYAAYMILALPVVIWGYQLGFNYINKDLFTPNPLASTQNPTPNPAPNPAPNPVPNPAPDAVQADNKKAPAAAKRAANKQAAEKPAPKKTTPKQDAPAKQGRGKTITTLYDKQRKASTPKAAVNAKKSQHAPAKQPAADKVPAKRRRIAGR